MKLRSLTLGSVALGALIGASLLIAPAGAASLGGGLGGSVGSSVGGTVGGASAAGLGAGSAASGGIGASTSGASSDVGVGTSGSIGANGTGTGATVGGDTGANTSIGATAPAGVGANGGIGMNTGGAASAGVPLASLPASTSLAQASVQSADGAAIGTVSKVSKDSSGNVTGVKVKLQNAEGATNAITLTPDQLSFNQGSNIVVSSLTQSEIDSLAAAQKQTH